MRVHNKGCLGPSYGYDNDNQRRLRAAEVSHARDATRRENGRMSERLAELDAERDAVQTLTEGTVADDEAPDAITDVFDALARPEQRYVLTLLLRAEGGLTVADLVDYVVEQTADDASANELRRRVTEELTHTHLPALASAGFVTYNLERQLVRSTDRTELARPYVEIALAQQSMLGD